jgi:hypothetical protein
MFVPIFAQIGPKSQSLKMTQNTYTHINGALISPFSFLKEWKVGQK